MAIEEREVAAIQRLGLTEYEARIYLALVKLGPIKASELSFFGQIPRTKTYGAVKELERKGLLHVLPGKPGLYAPSSPSEVLVPLVSKLSGEVNESEKVVQGLTLSFESRKYVKGDVPKEASEFWRIDGRRSLFEKLNGMLNDASEAVNYCTTGPGLIRAFRAHSDGLEKAGKRGALVRILASISAENTGVARELSHIAQLRKLEGSLASSFVSVDSKELVIIESKPDDLRTDRGSDSAIMTTNKLLIELSAALFDQIWKSSSPLESSRPLVR